MKKTIVITGGSEGLGKEIAKILATDNQVIILAPNKAKLEKVAEKLNCDYQVCDITDLEQVKTAAEKITKKYKRIDCLINNAGIWIEGELSGNDPVYIKKVLEVNTLGTIWMTRMLLPQMKKQKRGHVINIVSQAGLRSKEKRTVYNASKYAMTGFTDSLRLEVAKYNIAVTGVYPYKLKTNLFYKAGIKKDLGNAIDPREVAKAVKFILGYEFPVTIPHLEIGHIKCF